MIISHKYKFIFIKNRKTAGTSFEVFIKPFLGPSDIVTCIEELDSSHNKKYNETCNNVYKFRQHMSISQVYNRLVLDLQILTEEQFVTYHKFCFIRNPFDFYQSLYAYSCFKNPSLEKNKSFPKWVLEQTKDIQWPMVTIDNFKNETQEDSAPLINHAFLYEELIGSITEICLYYKFDIPGLQDAKNKCEFIKSIFPHHLAQCKSALTTQPQYSTEAYKHIQQISKQMFRFGRYRNTLPQFPDHIPITKKK